MLAEIHPSLHDRAECLRAFINVWQNNVTDYLQQSGLEEADQQTIQNHLATGLSVLVNSMDDSSEIVPPLFDTHYPAYRPEDSFGIPVEQSVDVQPFYMEAQIGAQCGRHAANMFFGESVLKDDGYCENIKNDVLFNKMKTADPYDHQKGPLVMMNMSLFSCDDSFVYQPPTYRRRAVPDSLDQLPGDFVLATGGHYVCFKKGAYGQWYLLDSVANQPRAILPSTYLKEIYGDLVLTGHTSAEKNVGRLAVICRDPGQPVDGFLLEP